MLLFIYGPFFTVLFLIAIIAIPAILISFIYRLGKKAGRKEILEHTTEQ